MPKRAEVRYRAELTALTAVMRKDVATTIPQILVSFEAEYVSDAYSVVLSEAFDALRAKYRNVDQQAQIIATAFVSGVDSEHRRRFYAAMERATGVNYSQLVQDEGLGDDLRAAVRRNVKLIETIPSAYFDRLENMVWTEITQGSTAKSMITQIREIGHSEPDRARLIARDQTSKLNSQLNQARQENLGIEEYVWRTVGDDRVRTTHKANNGKTFKWSDPPDKTGHPGHDIQCRCIAQPIITL